MAKQTGAIRFKGKMANVVGFGNKDAAKAGSTFVRERVTEISNPKTYSQCAQRAKLTPAANFYAAFEPVLNHAFIPSGTTGRNRAQFMKHAMALGMIPDVLKGESVLPCLPYQISKGNLGLDRFTALVIANQGGVAKVFQSGIAIAAEIGGKDTTDVADFRTLTIGELSADLIEKNQGLTDGMELTFLAVIIDDYGTRSDRYAVNGSIVLNSGDAINTVDDLIPVAIKLVSFGGKLSCQLVDIDNNYVRSFGIIISSKSATSWKYTTSFMLDSPLDVDGAVTEDEVVASYQDSAASRTSDRILQQADNSSNGRVSYVSFANDETVTLSPEVAGAVLNHNVAAVAKNSLGETKVIVDENGNLQYYAGNSTVQAITKTVSEVVTPVNISETTLAGNPTVTVRELGF